MGAVTAEEVASLQREFDWVLDTEVDNVTKQLKAAVTVSFDENICYVASGIIIDNRFAGVCQQVPHQGWRPELREERPPELGQIRAVQRRPGEGDSDPLRGRHLGGGHQPQAAEATHQRRLP